MKKSEVEPAHGTGMCPHGNFPTKCDTCALFAEGQISEAELKNHWTNPEQPLFQTEIERKSEGGNRKTKIELRALTPESLESLLESLKESWGDSDNAIMRKTFEDFFEQRKLDHPGLLNVEYYITTDVETGKPIAVNGIFTMDIQGTGLATRDQLDATKHHMTVIGAWTAVDKAYQGRGIGKYLMDWSGKFGKNRGAYFRAAETDDGENEQSAVAIFKKMGMRNDFNIKDYFGPGRDLHTYYTNIDNSHPDAVTYIPSEEISEANRQEIIELGRSIYTPARFEEFQVALDLVLKHRPGERVILPPKTFIERDGNGNLINFAIMSPHLYQNTIYGYWYGARDGDLGAEQKLLRAMMGMAKAENRGVLILNNDGPDTRLGKYKFNEAKKDGIPEVWEKGDDTRFLFYTKQLN